NWCMSRNELSTKNSQTPVLPVPDMSTPGMKCRPMLLPWLAVTSSSAMPRRPSSTAMCEPTLGNVRVRKPSGLAIRTPGVVDLPVEVVLVAAHDAHVDELARAQPGLAAVLHLHQAVDLRRVGHRARDRQVAVDGIDDAALDAADLRLQALRGDVRLALHEARQTLLLHLFRHRVRQRVGRGPLHRRIGEGADAVELRFV